jgi:ArsR family transcriptional regulator, arsenate/arsenite/antimonite-responsive transcriptional repressor
MPRTPAGVTRAAPPPAADLDGCCAPAESPLSVEDAARFATVLKALADPHRLRMVSLLAAQPADEPLCVCDVEASFDLSQPTVSHHLRVLREAGLVSVAKRGLWHYYALVPGALDPVQDLLAGVAHPK